MNPEKFFFFGFGISTTGVRSRGRDGDVRVNGNEKGRCPGCPEYDKDLETCVCG